MSDVVICCENLSKQYRIGARQEPYRTLRDSLADMAKAPFRALMRRGGPASRKDAETIWALKDVSFQVKRGEVVGIIGRNGAGKSTLLSILSRITEPTAGRARLKGRIAALLEVGTGFSPELTGRENIYLNAAILGMKKVEIDRKFDEIVAFAEVEKFIDTPVKHYSSGMYMRLAFAVAAHLDTNILLVDEVLAVGDLAFQRKCMARMSDITQRGRTVIFVSHNLDAVNRLCNRVLLLSAGRSVALGLPQDVLGLYSAEDELLRSLYELPPPEDADAQGRVLTLGIEDEGGRPTSVLPVGRPWQVRVRFVVKRRLEHGIVGLGLSTSTGFAVQTSWSPAGPMEPGEYVALFGQMELQLALGRYALSAGFSDVERPIHYVQEAGFLEIAPAAQQVSAIRQAGTGVILNPMTVLVQRM